VFFATKFLLLPYVSSIVSVTFSDLLYILFIAPSPLPLEMLGGLVSRPWYAWGLGFANLRFLRPEGFLIAYVRSPFKCLLLIMHNLKSCDCETLGPRPSSTRRLHLSLHAELCSW
jgi:hypothetical protein